MRAPSSTEQHASQSGGEVVVFPGGFNLDFELLLRDGSVRRFLHPAEGRLWRQTMRRLAGKRNVRIRTFGSELEDWELAARREWLGYDDLEGRTYAALAYLPNRPRRFEAPQPDEPRRGEGVAR